ncbi:hypothetical protein N1F78_09705 [Seonamhaeicola sp. MEBiC1930]|uniref:hypothetical protein n=1 Tax=Seonamhaeicola sp. MEBiC01930 TaxID=2976768 RepID=UPI00324FC7DD
MGGEGSAMAANTSLKNNRSMLKKRKGKSSLGVSYAGVELKEFPNVTEDQLIEIKEKLQKQNRRTKGKQVILFIILLVALILGFLYLTK